MMGLKISFTFANGLVWYKAENIRVYNEGTFLSLGTFPRNITYPREVRNQLHLEYDDIKIRSKLSYSEVS